jgi:uncharacterized membrane protein YhaH (DUF805 family)
VTFLESIKTCLIDKPFTFSGRASRSEYWWFVLFYFLIGFLIDSVLETLFPYSTADWVNRLIPLAIDFVILLVLSSGTCRRLHDINRSGWWQLINFIPVVGWIVSLYWMIKKGTPGPNRFGEDPLAKVDAFGDISG